VKLALAHAALLIAALAFAYQTWTRDDRAALTPESVTVWRADPEDVARIVYQTPRVRVVLEPRSDDVGRFVWGTATFTRTGADASAGDSVIQFVGDEQAEGIVEAMAAPLAVRDLGVVEEEMKGELGLADSEVRLTVEVDGEARELRVGGQVFASGDRYVESLADGRVYVFLANDLNGLENGGSILVERRVLRASADQVAEATVTTPSSSRTMRKIADASGAPAWAPAEALGRPDQSFGTFMERLGQLTIVGYVPELDRASLQELARIEYRDADGELLEQVQLLRSTAAAPEYFVLTPQTRGPARVYASGAEPLAEDLAQLF
jgi:hypothetical protein